MSEHEPDEPRIDRALIEQARPALGPSDAQRARLKRAVLAAAVGSAAAGTAAVASGTGASATTAGVGLGTKIAIAVFAVVTVGGGAWLATRDEAAPASSEVHEPVSAPLPIEPAVEPAPVVAPPPTVEPAAEPVPVVVAPPSTAAPEVEEARGMAGRSSSSVAAGTIAKTARSAKVQRWPIPSIEKPDTVGPRKPEMEKPSASQLKFTERSPGGLMAPTAFCTAMWKNMNARPIAVQAM